MIDFNMSEIVVLAVLAVIIFGPEKLPELARKAARVLNYVRNIANDAQGRLREELGPEFADMQLADLNPKALVDKHLLNPVQSELAPLKSELEPLKSDLEQLKSEPGTGGQAVGTDRPVDAPGAPRAVAFDTEAT